MMDLTLISCNYNTPDLISTMLKSWAFHNINISNKCLIVDNSSDEDSMPFLLDNKIPHVVNRKELHHRGVQVALDMVKTKYALLVDSDVVFNKSIEHEIISLVNRGIKLAGRVEASRGGHNLHPRVHPWFCFIDMDFVNYYGIRFTDPVRIRTTNSGDFYSHVPDCKIQPQKRYDVGSTFLEDVLIRKGEVLNISYEPDFFTHYEGMSWHKFARGINPEYIEGRAREYKVEYDKYVNVDVNGLFSR